MRRSFRTLEWCHAHTQGVALGWYASPRRGDPLRQGRNRIPAKVDALGSRPQRSIRIPEGQRPGFPTPTEHPHTRRATPWVPGSNGASAYQRRVQPWENHTRHARVLKERRISPDHPPAPDLCGVPSERLNRATPIPRALPWAGIHRPVGAILCAKGATAYQRRATPWVPCSNGASAYQRRATPWVPGPNGASAYQKGDALGSLLQRSIRIPEGRRPGFPAPTEHPHTSPGCNPGKAGFPAPTEHPHTSSGCNPGKTTRAMPAF